MTCKHNIGPGCSECAMEDIFPVETTPIEAAPSAGVPQAPASGQPGVSAEEIKSALAAELERVSTLEFNSKEICRHYGERVLSRLSATDQDAALIAFLTEARAASVVNFGPGPRTAGVCNHIRKELAEIEAVDGSDPVEWMDVVILAFDGAMRAGHEPADLIQAWRDKQALNQTREWPDWRTLPPDAPIEHVRNAEGDES